MMRQDAHDASVYSGAFNNNGKVIKCMQSACVDNLHFEWYSRWLVTASKAPYGDKKCRKTTQQTHIYTTFY